MKNITVNPYVKSFSFILILIASFFACKKLQQLLTFKISNESTVTIPSSSPVGLPFNVSSPDVATNSSQQMQNNNSSIALVKNILLDQLQMTITNPANQNFAFLKSIHIYISTNSSNEIELAYLDSIPTTATSITLIPTTSPLDVYVKASSYNLRTATVIRQVLANDVSIKIASQFKVTANL
jgi:hypothetical protein